MVRGILFAVAVLLGLAAAPASASTIAPGSMCVPHFALDWNQSIAAGKAKGVVRFGAYENSVASVADLSVYCPISTSADVPFVKNISVVIGTELKQSTAVAQCALIYARNGAGVSGWSGASYTMSVKSLNSAGSQILPIKQMPASWPAIAGIACTLPPGFSVVSYRYDL